MNRYDNSMKLCKTLQSKTFVFSFMFQQNWCYWLETGMSPSIGMLDEQKCCYGLDTEYSDFKEAIIATNRAEVTSKIESSAGEGGKRSHNSLDRFSPSKESSNSGEDNTDGHKCETSLSSYHADSSGKQKRKYSALLQGLDETPTPQQIMYILQQA
ncbi:unnamed protein product [Mytilus edulis]|uniref:Uncharacterized protein n=1 Tax=Mytilus edulis TaxID=6550 RepID=A0A8S3RJF0_MYTED|nr:unnamed protein product [Mytilus edulis]